MPLQAAQAGAIDVISFLEARAEDPVAIQCFSAVPERYRVPGVRKHVINHSAGNNLVETLHFKQVN